MSAAAELIGTRAGRRLLLLALALVAVALFAPSVANDFVDWDDNLNFLSNPYYRGLGWRELRWMFGATVTGHYIPVTWVTLGLDYLLWGMNPAGYHLTNVMLHTMNVVLVALVALRLLRLARRRSSEGSILVAAAAATLFFALHPLRVESVAWVTERRGLLSASFALLTVLAYLRACAADGGARARWLALSVGCYVLALFSKAAVAPLPCVLLVLDVYPLGRLRGGLRRWAAPEARRVVLEKLPYVVLAGVAGALALAVVYARGILLPAESYAPSARLAMLAHGLVFYVEKTFVPLGLNPLYELPARVSPLAPPFLASIVAAGLVTCVLVVVRRRWPAGLAVWLAYALVLLPVSGVFQAGHQLVADRYTYLSCLPWALLVGAAVSATVDAAATGRLRRTFAALAGGAVLVWIAGLATLTWFQVPIWRDTETLWRHALELDPACAICHNQLGAELGNRGDVAPAIHHFERAVALRSDDAGMRSNLGLAFLKTGRPVEAIPHLAQAIARDPVHVESRVHLGVALLAVGRVDEAIAQLREAVRRSPTHARARFELAQAYLLKGDRAAADEQAEVLRRLDPRLAAKLK